MDDFITRPKALRLPPATFIYGPRGINQTVLANAISACDPGMQQVHLDDPIDDVIRTLFSDGYDVIEPREAHTSPLLDDMQLPLVKHPDYRVKDFRSDMEILLHGAIGADARAKLAVAQLSRDPFVPERLLFVGVHHQTELSWLVERYGPRLSTTIWLATLNYVAPSGVEPLVRVVVPHRDPVEQMKYLRHELGDLFE